MTRNWSGLLLLALLVIYLPDIGHGFIKDDFVWIEQNQARGLTDLLAPFTDAPDFYRPLVALSFAADWWLFGAEPFGYGLTNLAFLLAGAAVLWSFATTLGLSRGAALACSALWTLNFHGIDMALLWISGRTSLLATLFSLLAARAFVRGAGPWAAGWALLAMLSKEEAVLLPFVLLAWAALQPAGVLQLDDDGAPGRTSMPASGRCWPTPCGCAPGLTGAYGSSRRSSPGKRAGSRRPQRRMSPHALRCATARWSGYRARRSRRGGADAPAPRGRAATALVAGGRYR